MTITGMTITGADDGVDPRTLLALSEEFPWVEWGILFSRNIYGGISLIGWGVKAAVEYLKKREQSRRMDQSTWTTEDVAVLFALKQIECKNQYEKEKAFEKALSDLHRCRNTTGA